MNNLLKDKPHYIVVGLAFLIAFFSNDVAYNFGRLLALSLISIGLASLVGRKSEPQKALTFKLLAAFIPLVVICYQVYSDFNQKQSLNSISQSLNVQKDLFRSALLDDDVKLPPNPKKELDFSQFKVASNNADLIKQVSELAKFATYVTVSTTNEQKNFFADIGWNDSLSPDKLSSQSDAINLRVKAQKYDAFLDKYEKYQNEFIRDYSNAFRLIATNFPNEIKAFEAESKKSMKIIDESILGQREIVKEVLKLSYLLQDGYQRKQVQYSAAEKNLIFYDNTLLAKYNQSIQNLNSMAQNEERILKDKYEQLQRLEKKMTK